MVTNDEEDPTEPISQDHPTKAAKISSSSSKATPQARHASGTQTLRTYVYRGSPQDREY
jgi:hypothetical protein